MNQGARLDQIHNVTPSGAGAILTGIGCGEKNFPLEMRAENFLLGFLCRRNQKNKHIPECV